MSWSVWWVISALAGTPPGTIHGQAEATVHMLPEAAGRQVRALTPLEDGSVRVEGDAWTGRVVGARVMPDAEVDVVPVSDGARPVRTDAGWQVTLGGQVLGGEDLFGACAASEDAPTLTAVGDGVVSVARCDGDVVVRHVGAHGKIAAAPTSLGPEGGAVQGVAVAQDADGAVLLAGWDGQGRVRVTTWVPAPSLWVWSSAWLPVGPPVDVPRPAEASDPSQAAVVLDVSMSGAPRVDAFGRAGDVLVLAGTVEGPNGASPALFTVPRVKARVPSR